MLLITLHLPTLTGVPSALIHGLVLHEIMRYYLPKGCNCDRVRRGGTDMVYDGLLAIKVKRMFVVLNIERCCDYYSIHHHIGRYLSNQKYNFVISIEINELGI